MKVRTMNDYINDIATEIAEEINNNEHSYPQDITAEIVDSYVPVYNHRVIEFATELEGQDWSDVWLGDVEFLDGENIIRQLQINIYNLLYEKVCSHEKIKDLI